MHLQKAPAAKQKLVRCLRGAILVDCPIQGIPLSGSRVQALWMRAGIVVSVTPHDRSRLEAIVADRNTRQKHAARARVIIPTAAGCGTTEIMRRSGLSKPGVWRWQERFMLEGVALASGWRGSLEIGQAGDAVSLEALVQG